MIDKNSSVVLYEQVAQLLEKEIIEGKFGERGCIGTHGVLAERFDVSLITIRKAIQILEEKGLVVVKQGKGTFVKSQPLKDDLYKLTALSSMIARNKKTPIVSIRSINIVDTPNNFEDHIKKGLGDRCYLVERIHKAENNILGYTKLYIPVKFCEKFTRKDLELHSTYFLFENKLHIKLGKGVQYIGAEKAKRDIAEALQVEEKSPILLLTRESYSDIGILLEYMQVYYEYYQYIVKVELELTSD